ncbi:GntR family transcriptional regulator [Corynebacterium glyciniphilum]|uniref:GntR family transcriptional regulator n=1 Tax=Corynebacterium glyciniphilum TaxID=1404244 RepID=UPI003FCF18D7
MTDTIPSTTREQPLSDRTYEQLREMLMNGTIDPHHRLVEGTLSQQLGVSRTPLREAIVRLHADGLLDRRNDGYYFRTLDFFDVRDLYEYRIALELWGLTRVIENSAVEHDRAKLLELRDAWRELQTDPPDPGPDFVLVDESFHVDLSAASGNREVTAALEGVNARIRPVRMYDYHNAARISSTITEHIAVVDEVLAGDLSRARELLRMHVGESLDVVEERAIRSLTNLARKGGPRQWGSG